MNNLEGIKSMFGEFVVDIIKDLITNIIEKKLSNSTLDYFKIRKIKSRIEDVIADVVETLVPFFANEGIDEERQYRLITTCVDELKHLTSKPELFFQGSLDGQKIFEEFYTNNGLPNVIAEDGLSDIYALLFPRIATLVCKIPEVINNWQNEAWAENFKRFDEITFDLQKLIYTVDELKVTPDRQIDGKLNHIRRALAQKIRFDLDLTGLRADRPLAGKFDNFFVHPEILCTSKKKPNLKIIATPEESISNFVHQNKQAIIIAPPGGGKSTWSKWLQRELLSTKWNGITIRFELRRFSVEETISIYELIRDTVGKHFAESLKTEYIDEWLKLKKVAIILDGFDEIKPNNRDNIYEWIMELNIATKGCPIIITSRPITTDHLDRFGVGWTWWLIEAFNEERIIEYIKRWYAYTPLLNDNNRENNAEKLAKSWKMDPTIKPLTGNPLLLSTLLMVHHLDGSLPNGRSQLYRRYIDGMLGIWDDRRKVSAADIQLSPIQKRRILRNLAVHMFLEEKDQIDETNIVCWLDNFLKNDHLPFEVEEILTHLRERTGLIVGPGIYNFIHKSVAEYLVAETILDGSYRIETGVKIDRFCLFENRKNDRWNTVMFLWAGLAPTSDVQSFIEQCLKMNECKLSYGILFDQYVRLSPDFCRKFVLSGKCISEINKLCESQNSNHYWACGHSVREDYRLSIPDFKLTSITNRNYFFSLLGKMVEDKIITWEDYLNTEGVMHELIWMAFMANSNESEILSEALKCLPYKEEKIKWLYWASECIIRRTSRKSKEDLCNAIKICCDCLDVRGVIVIALVSIAVQMLEFSNKRQYVEDVTIEIVKNIIEVLPNIKKEEIDNKWLLNTLEWKIDIRPNEDSQDIFENFIGKLEYLAKEGVIKQDDIYNSAINYILDIKVIRQSLIK